MTEELPDDHPRKYAWLPAGTPETIPPESPELVVEWTSEHAATLASNDYSYRQYARRLLDGRPHKAFETREEMLTLTDDEYARARPEDLSDTYLIALVHTVERWPAAANWREKTSVVRPFSPRSSLGTMRR